MVGHAGEPRVHIAAAEVLGGDDFAGCRLHQRRSAEKDRALVGDDDRLVAHRRHVRAAGRARPEHYRDLRDPRRRHRGLVIEDAAEVLAIGKYIVLVRQIRSAGVDQVDAGQPVLARDLLGAQVLFYRDRVIRSALDGRVVADDHALAARDPSDAGDDAGRRCRVLVHIPRGELRQLEKWRAGIEQHLHAVARQQLAACDVLGARFRAAADRDLRDLLLEVGRLGAHRIGVGPELGTAWVEPGLEDGHRCRPDRGPRARNGTRASPSFNANRP